jgi:hypothetical protein
MKRLIISLFFVSIAAASASAGGIREVELTDGSVIAGEVLSLSNGVYTIKSGTLGTMKISESKIRAIREKDHGAAGSAQSGQAGDAGGVNVPVKSLQDKMMNDGEIMDMVKSLQNDRDFQKILEDPEVMKAVNSGDIAALMANPGFMKLLDNKTVQDIQNKVKK